MNLFYLIPVDRLFLLPWARRTKRLRQLLSAGHDMLFISFSFGLVCFTLHACWHGRDAALPRTCIVILSSAGGIKHSRAAAVHPSSALVSLQCTQLPDPAAGRNIAGAAVVCGPRTVRRTSWRSKYEKKKATSLDGKT